MNVETVRTEAPKSPTDLTRRDLSWFFQRVQRGQTEVFTEIVTVTPDIARRLLEENKDNRKINDAQVRQIAEDISKNRYALNGETIVISKEGLLNDGQHRLLGVIHADKPIQTAMMFGVVRDSRFTINMGRQRSSGQFLQMAGVTNYSQCASTASLLLTYRKNIYAPGTYSAPTKQAVLRSYRDDRAKIDNAVSWIRGHKIIRAAGVAPFSVAYITLGNLNQPKRDEFFDGLAKGANLDLNSSILGLRHRLLIDRSEALRPWNKLELTLRHWNAWREDTPVKGGLKLVNKYPKLVK